MSCTCKEISISFSFKVLHLLFTSRSMHDKIKGSLIQQGSTFRKKPWGIASKFSDVVAKRESFSDEKKLVELATPAVETSSSVL